ncbi:MAG: NAD-dependent epimerase/dehydratase family protein [Pseudomonas atacamensis]|uniref:NAD-dependent epimerase/dehydratase family protein n=1 Tax=Pseudomonas atacamensis TaxID=2565368 RepID=UPI00331603CF
MSSLNCLVLGGSGFIGTNLCIAWRSRVRSVRAFSRQPLMIDGVDSFVGDFLNSQDLIAAVKGIDVVYHLVSTNTPASANASPLGDVQENVVQTLKLMEACRGAGVRRIVFVSSGGTVYGDAVVVPTPEGSLEQPISAYGISKLAIEKYIALYERLYGITAIVLRVSNPYGPYQYGRKQQGVIGTFISKTLKGEDIEIWGDGSVVRDYIYIDDVVDALLKTIQYPGKSRVFNIGSSIGVALNDIVTVLAELMPEEPRLIYREARGVDVVVSILDCSLAKRELDWQPYNDLRSGISKTLSWFHKNDGVI